MFGSMCTCQEVPSGRAASVAGLNLGRSTLQQAGNGRHSSFTKTSRVSFHVGSGMRQIVHLQSSVALSEAANMTFRPRERERDHHIVPAKGLPLHSGVACVFLLR